MLSAVLSSSRARPAKRLPTTFAFLIASAAIGLGISYSAIYLFHVALVLYLADIYLRLARGRFVASGGTQYHLPLLLFITWYVASILWAANITYALKYVGYLFCGLVIVFAMAHEIRDEHDLVASARVLLVCFAVEIAICVLEVFTPFRYPISPFSRYAALFARPYSLEQIDNPFALAVLSATPTGFQWNPNNLAATLVLVAPFVPVVLRQRRRWIIDGIILLLVTATGSRASFIALSLILVLRVGGKSWRRMLVIAALTASACLAVPSVLGAIANRPGRVGEMAVSFSAAIQFVSKSATHNGSASVRQELLRNGLVELERTRGWGVGAGGSLTVQERHGTVNGVTSMHNFWFEVVVEGGVYVGSLFLLWYAGLLVRMLYLARRARSPMLREMAKACALGLTGFTIAAISASSTIYLLPMWVFFGFCLGVMNASRHYLRGPRVAEA